MNSQSKLTNEEIRQRLERRADTVRSRLLTRLDVLDERRHRFMHEASVVGAQVKRYAPAVGGVIAGIGLVAAVVVVVKRRQERKHPWINVAARLLLGAPPPEPEQPSVLAGVIKKAAFGFGVRVAKRMIEKRLLGAEQPAGLPAATSGVAPGQL